jgi:hypothetical protein
MYVLERVAGSEEMWRCPSWVKCECGGVRKYIGLIPHDFRRSAAKAARRAGVPRVGHHGDGRVEDAFDVSTVCDRE